jgi:hypothetical protein
MMKTLTDEDDQKICEEMVDCLVDNCYEYVKGPNAENGMDS